MHSAGSQITPTGAQVVLPVGVGENIVVYKTRQDNNPKSRLPGSSYKAKKVVIPHLLIAGGVGIGQDLASLRKFDSGISS